MEEGKGYHAIPKLAGIDVVPKAQTPGDRLTMAIGRIVWGIFLTGLLIVPLLAVLIKEARILLGWALR